MLYCNNSILDEVMVATCQAALMLASLSLHQLIMPLNKVAGNIIDDEEWQNIL